MRRWVLFSIFLVSVITVYLWLPFGEFLSWSEFRFFPNYAKQVHFVRLKKSHEFIYLLGTVHDAHFEVASKYPYYELASVLQTLMPNQLLVEIRSDSIAKGRWGEGPPEMPYAVAIAQGLGIPVKGIDFWRADYKPLRDFDEREDKMARLILSDAEGRSVTLVLTGYSHIAGFTRRLQADGFQVDQSFKNAEKLAAFSRSESDVIPRSYFEAVSQAVRRVADQQSDYSKIWASKRIKLLKYLESK